MKRFLAMLLIVFLLTACGAEKIESADPTRDHPDGAERLSFLCENETVWVALSTESHITGRGGPAMGDLVVTVYTQENAFLQDISYGAILKPDVGLLDYIRESFRYITLEDVNGDGADDLHILVDDAPPEGKKLYRDFLWNKETHRFEEDK